MPYYAEFVFLVVCQKVLHTPTHILKSYHPCVYSSRTHYRFVLDVIHKCVYTQGMSDRGAALYTLRVDMSGCWEADNKTQTLHCTGGTFSS